MTSLKLHFQKHYMHYVAAVLTYAMAALLMSKSYDGYIVRQGDSTNFKGMSKEIYDAIVLFEKKPAWTNAMFGGMPATHISPRQPAFNVPGKFQSTLNKITGYRGVTVFWLAMLGGYILALALGASPWIGLLCAAGMGLSTFELLYFSAGHNTKVVAVAYMPFVLAGVLWAYRGRLFLGSALAAFATALHVSMGHPQMTYYLLFLLVGIGLVETWRMGVHEKNWKKALRVNGFILIAGIVGVLPRSAHLLETRDNAVHTIRGERILSEDMLLPGESSDSGLDREYILTYSMSDGEWLSIMCPDIKGGNSPFYWGEQKFSSGAFYYGAILVALFFMFLVAGRDRLRWPLLAVTLLAIILSRREEGVIMSFFIDHFPAYNQFRDTKMMLILVLMTVSIGAALGLKEIAAGLAAGEMESKRKWRWMTPVLALIGVFGSFYIVPEVFFEFQSTIRQDVAVEQLGYAEVLSRRLDIFRADVSRTLGLLIVTAGILAALLWGKVKPIVAVALLTLITTVDLLDVNKRYFNEDKVNGVYRNWVKKIDDRFPIPVEPQLMGILTADFENTPENVARAEELYASYLNKMKGVRLSRADKERLRVISQFGAMRFSSPYRVLRWEAAFNDSSLSYFFQSIGGYHAAKLRRYQDFMDLVLQPERKRFVESLQTENKVSTASQELTGHKMMNMKYIIFPQMEQPVPVPGVPGFAWAAESWEWADSPDEEIKMTAALTSPKQSIIHNEFKDQLEGVIPGATGQIELVDYTPERLEYRSNFDAAGLGVFSEIWYPEGWEARIDGERVETLRVNYVLRAMKVPAGEHTITWEFVYEPSETLDILFNLLLLLFVFGTCWWGMKHENEITAG